MPGPLIWGGAALLGGAALSGILSKKPPGRAHFTHFTPEDDPCADGIEDVAAATGGDWTRGPGPEGGSCPP